MSHRALELESELAGGNLTLSQQDLALNLPSVMQWLGRLVTSASLQYPVCRMGRHNPNACLIGLL
jgi:hypothetical protein